MKDFLMTPSLGCIRLLVFLRHLYIIVIHGKAQSGFQFGNEILLLNSKIARRMVFQEMFVNVSTALPQAVCHRKYHTFVV